jgi:hypothetical protein
VAKCRECGDFFCRECVVEHEGRMTCGTCMQEARNQDAAPASRRFRDLFRPVIPLGGLMLSFSFCWLFFALAGRLVVFLRVLYGGL